MKHNGKQIQGNSVHRPLRSVRHCPCTREHTAPLQTILRRDPLALLCSSRPLNETENAVVCPAPQATEPRLIPAMFPSAALTHRATLSTRLQTRSYLRFWRRKKLSHLGTRGAARERNPNDCHSRTFRVYHVPVTPEHIACNPVLAKDLS